MSQPVKAPVKFLITLRFGILAVFLSIFLISSLLMLGLMTWNFYKNATILTNQITAAISSSVVREIEMQLSPAATMSNFSAKLIRQQTLSKDSTEQLMAYTVGLLDSQKQAEMAYWGDEQGNFVIARRESDGSYSSEIISFRDSTPYRKKIFRNHQGAIIQTKIIDKIDYDPRQRPWYKTAKLKQDSIWSSVYLFYSGGGKNLGITSASPAYQDHKMIGVFGIDVRLQMISDFIRNIKVSKNGVVLIVNSEGKLIAYPGNNSALLSIDKLDKTWIRDAYHAAKNTINPLIEYTSENENYRAAVYNVPGFDKRGWKIFVIIPEKDILGPIRDANMQTLMICALMLLIGLILITLISKQISGPVRKLSNDLDRIKDFDLKESEPINSHIREVYLMSQAISGMKSGLRSFQKYVPQVLVRRLISSGDAAKLGGHSRRITLLFSDIKDFTSISEQLGNEDVMLQMCDYFDIIATAISEQQGVVDKYIGDAVMAFWGAPERDPKQAYHACMTALDFQERLHVQNLAWEKSGKHPFPTRIGIHTGEVLVGNMGSSDRLNYTALGDNVNIASRLEQLSKTYDTSIIVSQDTYQETRSDFIFRELDCVVVVGRKQSIKIYELLAKNTDKNKRKYSKMITDFEKALPCYKNRSWDEAIEMFRGILADHPHDKASAVFIERCEFFKGNKPPDDWHGEWTFTSK